MERCADMKNIRKTLLLYEENFQHRKVVDNLFHKCQPRYSHPRWTALSLQSSKTLKEKRKNPKI